MPDPKASKQPNIFGLLAPYRGMIFLLLLLALLSNALNLILPKLISRGIDAFTGGNFALKTLSLEFGAAALFIFIFVYLQSIVQTYASERVARDLRLKLSSKISNLSFNEIQAHTPAKLLTNLTSDIDSIKMFVAQAIVSIASSVFIIVGSGILLISINWKLGIAVLLIVPIIGGTFFFVLSKVRALFIKSREVIDWLNKVINESILGAALIRVLNSQQPEYEKFLAANTDAKNLGLKILRLFASMIPIVTFFASMATLIILALGGHFVINGSMTLGNFAAFNSYLGLLIFPIFVLGFMSNIIAQAQASYGRLSAILNAAEKTEAGQLKNVLKGEIQLKNITLNYGEKPALKDVSIQVAAGSKTAIIGPTAAGKTQILYLLTGLVEPNQGSVEFDGQNIHNYNQEELHKHIGFVFQDSIIFNLSLKENIAFNTEVSEADFKKALETAELTEFIEGLPEKLNTIVSERGTSLSGGQKQRIMLARALALNPKILLLDDFTARVDNQTELKILNNLAKNYPGLTLISVTQKISSIEHYDQIILLMEGEVLAKGTHKELLESSPEYVQIYESQKSTSHYENK